MKPVRVRFAPSPTGSLHIGGVRTALYNYLFAKKNQGKFIIRIEDTDQARFVPHAETYIYESLEWLGIKADESVPVGGPMAPYKQSERMDLYARHAWELVEKNLAYVAFDTVDELETIRNQMKDNPTGPFQYNAATRMGLKNSLTLPPAEVAARKERGEPFVIRLKVHKNEEVRLHDLIRGWVMVHSSTIDDKVLLKSDGMPTYHLANVVDDYLMQISHVIRGEEWLPSAPLHVLLYKAFGWENNMPQFAHLPLLLKPNGEGKLSKRDGEMFGFPVFPLAWQDEQKGTTIPGFREEGYLPEALVNFLAMLGWNPGTEQEFFTMEQLVDAFSLERIAKHGARFDIEKAKWFNHHYLQQKSASEMAKGFLMEAQKAGITVSEPQALGWINLVKERATFEREIWEAVQPVLTQPQSYEEQVVASKWNEEAKQGIQLFAQALALRNEISPDEAKELLNTTLEANGIKPGKVFQVLRLAITGKGSGLDLMTIIHLLGPQEIVSRIRLTVERLG